jgi:hypothetical protein
VNCRLHIIFEGVGPKYERETMTDGTIFIIHRSYFIISMEVSMSELSHDAARSDLAEDKYMSTDYSNKITCGICGARLHNVPVMYEDVNIDWRCGKCLRRDKPAIEEHIS